MLTFKQIELKIQLTLYLLYRLYAKHRRQHMTSPITKIRVSITVGYGCEDIANTT